MFILNEMMELIGTSFRWKKLHCLK
jgi:hypothetical protein